MGWVFGELLGGGVRVVCLLLVIFRSCVGVGV